MSQSKPVVLLEFNELAPSLMEKFIAEGHLPSFQKLRDSSATFVSEAQERAPFLEPWIQWVNVHTGVPYEKHGAFHLSDGHKVKQPAIWDLISDAGDSVWICGSMNVKYSPGLKGCVLPDPWSTDTPVQPQSLDTYLGFVRRQVQEHTNSNAKFGAGDYLSFLSFMVSHGLSTETISTTLKQLSAERGNGNRWRRAFILDRLQFDVFAALYKKEKPAFSTFFLNSTAHMQHLYWRNMDPESFLIKPSPEEQKKYATAILEGYMHMDRLVARALELVGDDATLILATALSQQPFLKFEEKGGKRIYRPKDIDGFLRWAGITSQTESSPVMSEQFWIHFENASAQEDAARKLSAITINGEPAMAVIKEENSIFSGFNVRAKIDQDAVLVSGAQQIKFYDLFYEIEGLKSGMHHPEGILWIRDARMPRSAANEHVPIESIAPTVLELLGVAVPAHMESPSLLHARSEAVRAR